MFKMAKWCAHSEHVGLFSVGWNSLDSVSFKVHCFPFLPSVWRPRVTWGLVEDQVDTEQNHSKPTCTLKDWKQKEWGVLFLCITPLILINRTTFTKWVETLTLVEGGVGQGSSWGSFEIPTLNLPKNKFPQMKKYWSSLKWLWPIKERRWAQNTCICVHTHAYISTHTCVHICTCTYRQIHKLVTEERVETPLNSFNP